MKKQEIVIFSMFNWESNLLHREHMLAKTFQELGYSVSFVERKYLKPQKIANPTPDVRTDKGVKIITVYSLPYMKGKSATIYKLNDKILSKQLREIFKSLGPKAWLLASIPYWVKAISDNIKPTHVLAYDLSDDLGVFATNDSWKKRLQTYHKEMVKEANLVFITTKGLTKKVSENKNVFVVENGVDLESYKKARPILRDKYEKLLAGYIGGIYQWVNLNLIKKTALRYPEIQFVLIGPTDRLDEVNDLIKLSNVSYLGEKNWQDIGDYFASLDIGLIPFVSEKKYPRLKTVDSNKVYQYASFGYPIISTDYSQVKVLKEIVDVCQTDNDFVEQIDKSLNINSIKLKEKRQKFASDHSWLNQTQKIISIFNNFKLQK